MSRFIINYDFSRKNSNNEFLPLKEFVPGVISLKNTYSPYTLYIGTLNSSALFNKIDVFKSNVEIFKKNLQYYISRTNREQALTYIRENPKLLDELKVNINNKGNTRITASTTNTSRNILSSQVIASVDPKTSIEPTNISAEARKMISKKTR